MGFAAFATLAYWLSAGSFVLFVLLLALEAYLKRRSVTTPDGPQSRALTEAVNPKEIAEAIAALLAALENTRPAIAALATSMLFFGLGLLSLYLAKP